MPPERRGRFSRAEPGPCRRASLPTVLTPHPLEAARLLGCTVLEVQTDRRRAPRSSSPSALAAQRGPEGSKQRDRIARPHGERLPARQRSLASAGTGDVLAGWLAGLWAPELQADLHALCGRAVSQHGATGKRCPARFDPDRAPVSDAWCRVRRPWPPSCRWSSWCRCERHFGGALRGTLEVPLGGLFGRPHGIGLPTAALALLLTARSTRRTSSSARTALSGSRAASPRGSGRTGLFCGPRVPQPVWPQRPFRIHLLTRRKSILRPSRSTRLT